VVTGFLGAGKTTLLNRWLADFAPGDVAVVVNEQGGVGVDGTLLTGRARTLVEITGGCICCVTQSELVRTLEELASSESPCARILVETSGAASPAGVLRAIVAGGTTGALALDGVITVVDASRVGALAAHELAIEQIGYADVIVLSRADACDSEAMRRCASVVAAHNGAAFVTTAARGELTDPALSTLENLLAQRRAGFTSFAPAQQLPTRSSSTHVYESVSLIIDGDVDGDLFADFVEEKLAPFAGRIFRVKGILSALGLKERMIVQGVADLIEVAFGDAWGDTPRTSRLVVIGFGLDRNALAAGFAACAARPRVEPHVRE
jgi:G3E family GTPase